MKLNTRRAFRTIALLVSAFSLIGSSGVASAQVKIFVGGVPGTIADVTARLIAKRLPGGTVETMENAKDDPSSSLQLLANLDPDGKSYLLLQPLIVLRAIELYPEVLDKIQGVSMVGTLGMAVMVNGANTVGDLASLIALAKSRPLKFANTGTGSIEDICGKQLLGSDAKPENFISYANFAPMIDAVVKGNADVGCLPLVPLAVKQHLPAKRLKALAVTLPRQHPELPNTPTLEALGVQGIVQGNWYMLVTQKAVDKNTLKPVTEAVRTAIADSAAIKYFGSMGIEAAGAQEITPEFTEQFLRKQLSLIASYARR